MQRRSLPSLLITVQVVARDYAQHLVWGIAKENAKEDVSVTAHPLAKSNAPVLVVKDALMLALKFAQADAEELAVVIVLENVKTNVCLPAKVHALLPVKARVPLPVKAHVITPARQHVLQPAEIPVNCYAQAPVLARVVPVVAMDVRGQHHCSKSLILKCRKNPI